MSRWKTQLFYVRETEVLKRFKISTASKFTTTNFSNVKTFYYKEIQNYMA